MSVRSRLGDPNVLDRVPQSVLIWLPVFTDFNGYIKKC